MNGWRLMCSLTKDCFHLAGGFVCGEGFLNGQLTVTRALGDFHPELLAMQRTRERLKYRVDDTEPLQLTGPLTSGVTSDVTYICD